MPKSYLRAALTIVAVLGLQVAYAAKVVVPMYLVAEHGQGKAIGEITLENALGGVLLTPNLHDLPAGIHGFHIHEKPDCDNMGNAAGGHLDPAHTGEHEGPYKRGHLGDLPVLIVDKDGNATLPMLAPRFKLSDIKNHALMIHAGGDNYSDKPEKLGGGGARIACGVVTIK